MTGTTTPENKLHVNGAIILDPIEPASPTAGFILYVDSADGDLKEKSGVPEPIRVLFSSNPLKSEKFGTFFFEKCGVFAMQEGTLPRYIR